MRISGEFIRGHIAGAVNINTHDPALPQNVIALDGDKTYIVDCAINPRQKRGDQSINVMTKLRSPNPLRMNGGIIALKRAGLPLDNR